MQTRPVSTKYTYRPDLCYKLHVYIFDSGTLARYLILLTFLYPCLKVDLFWLFYKVDLCLPFLTLMKTGPVSTVFDAHVNQTFIYLLFIKTKDFSIKQLVKVDMPKHKTKKRLFTATFLANLEDYKWFTIQNFSSNLNTNEQGRKTHINVSLIAFMSQNVFSNLESF